MGKVIEKPLFIPVKTEYFEAFKNGTKLFEMREYGKRWNEKTCRVGREVVVSKGYGKNGRLHGYVKKFERAGEFYPFSNDDFHALRKCFPDRAFDVAVIWIEWRDTHG